MEEGKRGVIFVFGSNKSGRHGAKAALHARQYKGAIYGQGWGRQGNSYAIPTKDYDVYTPLPLKEILPFVEEFIVYAKQHPELTFQVTNLGTGYAGYRHDQMAPMFKDAPPNVQLSVVWRRIIKELQDPVNGSNTGEVPASCS